MSVCTKSRPLRCIWNSVLACGSHSQIVMPCVSRTSRVRPRVRSMQIAQHGDFVGTRRALYSVGRYVEATAPSMGGQTSRMGHGALRLGHGVHQLSSPTSDKWPPAAERQGRPGRALRARRRRVTDASRNTTKCRFVVTTIGGPSSLPADEGERAFRSAADVVEGSSPFSGGFPDDGERALISAGWSSLESPKGSYVRRRLPRRSRSQPPGTIHVRRPKSRTKTSGPGLWSFGTRLPAQDEKVR